MTLESGETKRSGKPLPNNIPAERGLLGAIMLHNDALFVVVDLVKAADFYEPAHGEIFTLMRDQIEAGRGATPIVLMHDMAQDADIGGISASEYLAKLEREAPDPAVARQLAITIRDLAVRRVAIERGEAFLEELRSGPASMPAREALARYDANMQTLFGSVDDLGIRSIGDVAESVKRSVAASMKAEATIGIDWGLAALNDLAGPLMPGRLYILAGSPGAGKSALAQQIAEHVGVTRHTLFNSIEMNAEELAQRSIARETGIPAEAIERAALALQDFEPIVDAVARAKKLKLWIDGATAPTMQLIRSRAVRMQRLNGLELLVVDHLLYIAPPEQRMSAVDAVRPNLQQMKRLAKDLHIPIVLLTQFNAEFARVSWDKIRRPNAGDLFGGPPNEQEADVIVFIFREEAMLRQREPSKNDPKYAEWETKLTDCLGTAEFILGKRRGGKQWGRRVVGWHGEKTMFVDNATDTRRIAFEDEERRRNRDLARDRRIELDDEDIRVGQRPLAL